MYHFLQILPLPLLPQRRQLRHLLLRQRLVQARPRLHLPRPPARVCLELQEPKGEETQEPTESKPS